MKIKTLLTLICTLALSTALAEQSNGQAPAAKGNEATLSFEDIPELKEAYISISPGERNDGILVGELGLENAGKALILKLVQEIADSGHGNFDSYLIAHKGKLILESYYRKGRIDLPHPQASATKTYTSMALGRAIQLGYLTMADLYKPLTSFLKGLDHTKFVAGTEKITLHQALTMRSGIQLSAKEREEIEKNPAMVKGQKHLQAFLEHSQPITDASQQFAYKDDPRLVMQVIEAVVPGTAKDFIKRELLDKMGITNYEWLTEINGLPRSGSGTSLTSRDMLKWGILIINNGKWKGEQLVPAAFVEKATSKIVNQSEEYDDPGKGVSGTAYGYFTWQADLSVNGKSYLSQSARGGSGQNIIVVEELDLVIVSTTHRPVDDVTAVTATRALSAFTQNTSTNRERQSPIEFPSLKNRYLGQKTPGLTPKPFAPGIVASEEYVVAGGNFSPDMKEFYFSRQGGEYKEAVRFVMHYKNGSWSKPTALSIDNDQYVERFNPGWSEMKSLELFKNINVHGLSVSAKGTYYIDHYTNEGDGPLRISRLINGQREAPQPAEEVINTGKWVAHPFIAPDESYLLWDVEREGDHGADIYISFRQSDGTWGKAINMGDTINTGLYDQWPRVTPDGKYLLFWKGDEKLRADGSKYRVGSPYWVDAKIIETLRSRQ